MKGILSIKNPVCLSLFVFLPDGSPHVPPTSPICRPPPYPPAGRLKSGADFALKLVGFLHERVSSRPTSFHGGLFIGRDCHTIGDHSMIVCAALFGKVPLAHLAAYKEAWSPWNKVGETRNRAAIVPSEDVLAFRSNKSAMVTVLKGSFCWFSIPPKIHFLMFQAPEILGMWGSIGLHGEKRLQTWRGGYGQNAVKFPGAAELERGAGFISGMALASEAGVDVLARCVARRKPTAAGARKATKVTDERGPEKKPPLLQ